VHGFSPIMVASQYTIISTFKYMSSSIRIKVRTHH
jgi:hypothetical protein